MKLSFRFHLTMLSGALVLASLMSGCATQRRVGANTTTTQTDSVNTDVRVETRIEYKTDTIFVDVPAQMAERTTADSISFLENDFATSEARINQDGSLFHNLNTKPQKKPVEVQTPTYHKDSVRVEYKYKEVEVEKEIPVEVERDFTRWERTCIKWFPWSLIAIFLGVCLKFRKPLIAFAKRLIFHS